MNQEETLALWKQGKEAWNAWANKMLAERKALEQSGEWSTSPGPRGQIMPENNKTKTWCLEAAANFSTKSQPKTLNSTALPGSNVSFSGFIFPFHARWSNARFAFSADFSDTVFETTADFDEAYFEESVDFSGATFNRYIDISKCTFDGNVNCRNATFKSQIVSRDVLFKGQTYFEKTTFSGFTSFKRSTFEDYANFNQTSFEKTAGFSQVTFKGSALFRGSSFNSQAMFADCEFEGRCDFSQSEFSDLAAFANSRFRETLKSESCSFRSTVTFETCNFGGIVTFTNSEFSSDLICQASSFEKGLSLKGTVFSRVPDFQSTYWRVTPSLEDLSFLAPKQSTLGWVKSFFERSNETLASRYRALKGIAIQEHNHLKEIEYFALELKHSRDFRSPSKRFHWMVSVLYELLSNFGQSTLRPLCLWLSSLSLFFLTYVWLHIESARASSTSFLPYNGDFYSINSIVVSLGLKASKNHEWIADLLPYQGLACIDGTGSPWFSAFAHSLRKGFLFNGFAGTDQTSSIYTCLFGLNRAMMNQANGNELVYEVPNIVAAVGLVQSIISIILFFLVLLGIRNQFKIK